MLLRWEIDDPWWCQGREQVWHAQPDLLALATSHVILIHIREASLKPKSNPFAHHAHSIHRVDQRLRFGLEQVPDKSCDVAHDI